MTNEQMTLLQEATADCATHNGRFDHPDCRIVLSVSAVTIGGEFFKLLMRFWGIERTVKLGLDPACIRAAIAGVNKAVDELVHEGTDDVGKFNLHDAPATADRGRAHRIEHISEHGDFIGNATFETLPEALSFIKAAETTNELLT